MNSRDKVYENMVRRMAKRQGLRLVKSRRRDPLAIDFGCYNLVDIHTGAILRPVKPNGFAFEDLREVKDELTARKGAGFDK